MSVFAREQLRDLIRDRRRRYAFDHRLGLRLIEFKSRRVQPPSAASAADRGNSEKTAASSMRLRFARSTCFHRRDTNRKPSRVSSAKSASRLDRIDNGIYQKEIYRYKKAHASVRFFIEGASIARRNRRPAPGGNAHCRNRMQSKSKIYTVGPRSRTRAGAGQARQRRIAGRIRVRAKACAVRSDGQAIALQARARRDCARPSSRPHGRAEQAATAAGSRPHRHFPDRRFHRADRRPVGPQYDATAAIA